jgi:hypothetical protein
MKENQKQYKSNGNYTTILYSHELFTGYFKNSSIHHRYTLL